MHPNPRFRFSENADLLAVIRRNPFGRIIAVSPAGLRVAHAPLLVTGDGRIRFHLANANALTPHLDGAAALLLAEGPNAYLSANWYADVRAAVPTWNYTALECDGIAARLSRDALIDLVDALSAELEPRVGEDWTRTKMDTAAFDRMLCAITGFELTPIAFRGTRKLSQNQPEAQIGGVLAGFDRTAPAMAAAVRAARAEQ